MTTTPPTPVRRARRRQHGFTLLNVLVAAFIFGIGMLGVARTFSGITSASTQNEYVTSLASLGNSFWGTVQANPALVTGTGFNGSSYAASSYTSAPAALQPWLRELVQTLPGALASIATGPDSANGTACALATGCTVTLTISWAQSGSIGGGTPTRSQTFQYRVIQS